MARVLNSDQISDLEQTKKFIMNLQMQLKSVIDIQALLQILVRKGIITREEMDMSRAIVSKQPTYQFMMNYINAAFEEIDIYEQDPQARLKAMLDAKLNKK